MIGSNKLSFLAFIRQPRIWQLVEKLKKINRIAIQLIYGEGCAHAINESSRSRRRKLIRKSRATTGLFFFYVVNAYQGRGSEEWADFLEFLAVRL